MATSAGRSTPTLAGTSRPMSRPSEHNPWTTHRGDEWWYAAFELHATARPGLATQMTVSQITSKAGVVGAAQLLRLLRDTCECFPESRIYVDVTPDLSAALDQLRAEGALRYELINTGYGRDALIELVRTRALAFQLAMGASRDG